MKGKAIADVSERYEFLVRLQAERREEQHRGEPDYSLKEVQEEMQKWEAMNPEEREAYDNEIYECHAHYVELDKQLDEEIDKLQVLLRGSNMKPAMNPIRLSAFIEELSRLQSGKHTEKTVAAKRDALHNLMRNIGDVYLLEITTKAVEAFLAEKRQYIKTISVNHLIMELKAAFNKAVDWDYLERNPFAKVKKYRVEESEEPQYMTPEEFERFLAVIPEHEKSYADMYTFFIHTGLRREELRSLMWNDFSEETKEIRVRKTKNGKVKIVALTDIAFSILISKRGESESPYIFHLNGRQRSKSNVSHKCKTYLRAAGLSESLRLHSLRHTTGTLMVQNGASLVETARLLGHSSTAVTEKIYVHSSMESRRIAIKSLDCLPGRKSIHA